MYVRYEVQCGDAPFNQLPRHEWFSQSEWSGPAAPWPKVADAKRYKRCTRF